jgi:acyl carrier protein
MKNINKQSLSKIIWNIIIKEFKDPIRLFQEDSLNFYILWPLYSELEKKLKIKISDDECLTIRNINDLFLIIKQKTEKNVQQ